MELNVDKVSEKRAVVTPRGRINIATAPDMKGTLKRLADDGYIQLIVDMHAVTFIDSSGLAALVSAFKVSRQAGGTVRLVGLNKQTITVFEATLLDRVFEFYPDVTAALNSLPSL